MPGLDLVHAEPDLQQQVLAGNLHQPVQRAPSGQKPLTTVVDEVAIASLAVAPDLRTQLHRTTGIAPEAIHGITGRADRSEHRRARRGYPGPKPRSPGIVAIEVPFTLIVPHHAAQRPVVTVDLALVAFRGRQPVVVMIRSALERPSKISGAIRRHQDTDDIDALLDNSPMGLPVGEGDDPAPWWQDEALQIGSAEPVRRPLHWQLQPETRRLVIPPVRKPSVATQAQAMPVEPFVEPVGYFLPHLERLNVEELPCDDHQCVRGLVELEVVDFRPVAGETEVVVVVELPPHHPDVPLMTSCLLRSEQLADDPGHSLLDDVVGKAEDTRERRGPILVEVVGEAETLVICAGGDPGSRPAYHALDPRQLRLIDGGELILPDGVEIREASRVQ